MSHNDDVMYLFTTEPHPHGHWQLQELLGNRNTLVNTERSYDDKLYADRSPFFVVYFLSS